MSNPDAPAPVFSCTSTPIKGGKANQGILRHEISFSQGTTAFPLVEKRLHRKASFRAEFDICQQLCAQGRAGVYAAPLPQIISAVVADDHYSIVMPLYHGTGVQLDDWAAHAGLIARAVAGFNAAPVSVPEPSRMTKLLAKNNKTALDHAEYSDFARAALAFCEVPLPAGLEDATVPSHNDLYFPNIATETYEGTYSIVFIDLGHVGHNHIGAEFHHFLRAAMLGTCRMEMVEVMFETYAAATGTDRFLIALNAHRFALLRLVERLRGFVTQGQEARFGPELAIGEALLDAARSTRKNLLPRAQG